MNRFFIPCTALLAAGLAASALAQEAAPASSPPDRPLNSGDKGHNATKSAHPGAEAAFFQNGATAGLAEVAAGRTAEKRASSPRVRAFAQQMVKDHTQANRELKQLAMKKHMKLPAAPDDTQQQTLAKLKSMQGADFDKAYVAVQLSDHKDAVRLFETASMSEDPDISGFAQKTLPVLKHHLEMVQNLQEQSQQQ